MGGGYREEEGQQNKAVSAIEREEVCLHDACGSAKSPLLKRRKQNKARENKTKTKPHKVMGQPVVKDTDL